MHELCLADDGVTIKVGVHYESRSPRRIALKFQEAGVSNVHITSLAETLIAPALLPRGWLQQRILLALKEVSHCTLFGSLPTICRCCTSANVQHSMCIYQCGEKLELLIVNIMQACFSHLLRHHR